MKKKMIMIMLSLWLTSSVFIWIYPKQESSNEERRKLSQFPELTLTSLVDGQFVSHFESYAQDQFPYRFKVRQNKALFRYYGLGMFENNDYFIDEGKIIKIEYPVKENEIIKAGVTFETIRNEYLIDSDVYVSIIPDKSYYTNNQTIPIMDYEAIESLILSQMKNVTYVDIKDLLNLDDYYNTDIHWKQEKIDKVSDELLTAMNKQHSSVTTVSQDVSFTGVYSGHSALITKKDALAYVTNEAIESAEVTLLGGAKTSVYKTDAITARDQYDFFLHGPQAIVSIDNDNASSDDELIIFRDSFGSSIAPYFIDQYKRITLIDIRYISSSVLDEFVEFSDQDVLFIYNGTILNSSSMFK